jgi:hypothetical protein
MAIDESRDDSSRAGGSVHRAGADVPDHDAPDPRDRGGAAARAGRVAAEAHRRRRARAGGAAREPRRGGGGAVRGRVLRAGVRVVRVVRGEHGVRAALVRAARAVPPPRRGRRRRFGAARRGLGRPPLRPRVRRPRAVRGRGAASVTEKRDGFVQKLIRLEQACQAFLFLSERFRPGPLLHKLSMHQVLRTVSRSLARRITGSEHCRSYRADLEFHCNTWAPPLTRNSLGIPRRLAAGCSSPCRARTSLIRNPIVF